VEAARFVSQQWLLESTPNRFGFSFDDGTTL
jgi:hypothetical protein